MIVAVAGMHRSGTSMFARYLHRAGIAMGERFYEDRRTNPYGHYEDEEFLALQAREVAARCGGEDYLVTADFTPSEEFHAAGAALVAARRAQHGDRPWGWKDPRTTLFLPSWRALADDLHVVAMLRPPDRVVNSLCARLHGYWSPRKKDLFLATYTHYNRKLLAFHDADPARISIVDLERLIADPEPVLAALSGRLPLPLDPALFRDSYDPAAMSRVRRAALFLNRRGRRAAEQVHAELVARAP